LADSLRHVISYSSSLSRYVFEYQPIINQMPTRLSRNFRSHLPANAVSTTRNPFFSRDHAKNKSKIKLTVKENRIYSDWADEVSQWEKREFHGRRPRVVKLRFIAEWSVVWDSYGRPRIFEGEWRASGIAECPEEPEELGECGFQLLVE
jgi:hypothetical protein